MMKKIYIHPRMRFLGEVGIEGEIPYRTPKTSENNAPLAVGEVLVQRS